MSGSWRRRGSSPCPPPSPAELGRADPADGVQQPRYCAESSARRAEGAEATMAFLRQHIRHVIYIVKENRTYDQVLGDLEVGDGDPKLAVFGRAITPNLHAMARASSSTSTTSSIVASSSNTGLELVDRGAHQRLDRAASAPGELRDPRPAVRPGRREPQRQRRLRNHGRSAGRPMIAQSRQPTRKHAAGPATWPRLDGPGGDVGTGATSGIARMRAGISASATGASTATWRSTTKRPPVPYQIAAAASARPWKTRPPRCSTPPRPRR